MPTLRGATGVAFTAASVVLTLPAGTVAGDWACVMGFDGYVSPVLSNITNWIVKGNNSNGEDLIAYKQLTAADITAGSVTITWSNSYAGYAGIATFTSTVGPVGASSSHDSVTSAARSQTVIAVTADLAIYFAFKRFDGTTPTVTINRGSLVNASGVTNVGGAFYTEAVAAGGQLALTATYSASGGQTDGLSYALFSDTARSGGSASTALTAAGATFAPTGFVYKGRTTASADSGSVA